MSSVDDPRAAAFLLAANGCMSRLDVPLDAHGSPFKLESVGWSLFVQDMLKVEFTNSDGSELPRLPFEEWTAEDDFCLPVQKWDLTYGQDLPILMVKIFQCPYINWEHWNNVLPFNKIAPLFTDNINAEEYWRGDMLLVCYEGKTYTDLVPR
jgi:hypothetical protein